MELNPPKKKPKVSICLKPYALSPLRYRAQAVGVPIGEIVSRLLIAATPELIISMLPLPPVHPDRAIFYGKHSGGAMVSVESREALYYIAQQANVTISEVVSSLIRTTPIFSPPSTDPLTTTAVDPPNTPYQRQSH